jgi:hypothetical protein
VLLTFAAHFLKAGMRQIRAPRTDGRVEGSLRIRTVVDRRLEAKIGGDSAVQVSLDGSPAELRARIEEYPAAGVGHLVVYFEADDLQTTLRDMRRFAAEVCPAFHEPFFGLKVKRPLPRGLWLARPRRGGVSSSYPGVHGDARHSAARLVRQDAE